MSERLNSVTRKVESLGLVILKDADGNYVARGARNIKINGENIKPLLVAAVKNFGNIEVLNHVNIVDLLSNHSTVVGAWGFGIRDERIYVFRAKATLIATPVSIVRIIRASRVIRSVQHRRGLCNGHSCGRGDDDVRDEIYSASMQGYDRADRYSRSRSGRGADQFRRRAIST